MSTAWERLRKQARGGAAVAITAAVALALGLPQTTASAAPADVAATTEAASTTTVAGTQAFTAPAARPAELGVVYQGTWNIMSATQRGKVLDDLKESGVTWVTMDMGWINLEPNAPGQYSMSNVAEWDKQVTEIRARGLKIMSIFQRAPQWATGTANRNGRPKDPAAYGKAAAWVAKRYDGASVSPTLRIDAIQLWNEPNLPLYWAPEPATTKISSFATMIKTAGTAVKKANPNMKVIAAGVNSVDTTWYTEFVKTPGVIGTYDAFGVHPYQSPGDATPEAYEAKWGLYYMRHLTALDALMTTKNDPAKIWATEFGWSTHANTSTTPNWARGVSEAQQADDLVRSMPIMAASKRVQTAFWYAAITTSSGDAQFDNYALLRKDYSRKPAYYAMKCAAAGVCGPTAPAPTAPVPTAPVTTAPAPVPTAPVTTAPVPTAPVPTAPVPTAPVTTPPVTTPPVITPPATKPPTTTRLLAAGSSWRYQENGKKPSKSWLKPSYSDKGWRYGKGQLGFGEGDEKTVLKSGKKTRKPITTYFRTSFKAKDVSKVDGLRLKALVDDGAAVYLNGHRIWLTNLPASKLTYKTRALTPIAGAAEVTWTQVDLPAKRLRKGKNLLAVEIHQQRDASTDLSFDIALETR